jgi:HlyD family secretion protein
MTSNVVTYTVVINTDNSHLKFKPYLTANAKFLVQERSQVLRVPNSALRWRPALKLVAPEYRDEYARSLKQGRNGGAAGDLVNRATLWVTQGEFVQPVHVRTGLTDGAYTEVLDGDIDEGTEVVIREDRQDSGGGGGSPFTPSMFGGGKKQPQ